MRALTVMTMTLGILALACGGEDKPGDKTARNPSNEAPGKAKVEEPAPAPVPEPTVVTTEPVAYTFDQVAFKCCKESRAEGVLGSYLDIYDAMAAGETAKIEPHLLTLSGFAKKCHDESSAEDKRTCTSIEENAAAMKSGPGRGKMAELGRDVFELVQRHDGGGKYTVAAGHCDTNDGTWLQTQHVLKSPFPGPANRDCGAFVKAAE